ncbi:MAG: MFS transporter, partial [Oscillospiraceae bacterium]|nr:MFS transporter [Oscillospiraceae bacterium]
MKTKNRYLILTSGMIIQFCAGIIYLWSVFKAPVAAHLNWAPDSASLTASIMLSMFVLGIILGGRAQDKFGPRKATLVGSIMIGSGMACTALTGENAPWLVYITYAVIGGLGVGTVYMSTIAAAQKWFPDKRGFASGMIVGAFGLSSVVFAPLAKEMLAELGVPVTFLIFGAGFLIICGLCSLLIENPPQGYLPEGFTPSQAVITAKQYSPGEIIKTRQFYLLALGLLFTLPAFFILNPVFISLGEARGLSANLATLGVMLTGVGSASGRLTASWASDKTGLKPAMIS